MHCFGNISKDADQIKSKTLETVYNAPEQKIDLSAPMVLQDEVIEVDQADSKPIAVEKIRP